MWPGFKIRSRNNGGNTQFQVPRDETIPLMESVALNYKRMMRDLFYAHMEQSLKIQGFLTRNPHHKPDFNSSGDQQGAGHDAMPNRSIVRFAIDYKDWNASLINQIYEPLDRSGCSNPGLVSLAANYKLILQRVFKEYMHQSLALKEFLVKQPDHCAEFNAPLEQLAPKKFPNRAFVKRHCRTFAINKMGWDPKVVRGIENPL